MDAIPMQSLENMAEVEQRCAAAGGRICLTKNGRGHLVVMDADRYEKTMGEMHEAQALSQALDDVRAGRIVDGPSALASVESAHGL